MTVRAVSNNPFSPVYNSSAPNLTGAVGSLIALLDAVLVNGFSGFTALGWTKAYSGTNTAQYAMASGGTGAQVYVNDNGPGAAGAKEARFNGFKTGTGIGTGTNQFPTTSQQSTTPSGQLVIRKSNTADSTVRYWTLIGDGHTFYLITEPGDVTTPLTSSVAAFGDFFSYTAGDVDNCMIIGRVSENSANFVNTTGGQVVWGSQTRTSMVEAFSMISGGGTSWMTDYFHGHFAMGPHTGVGGSTPMGKSIDLMKTGAYNQLTPQMGVAHSGLSNQGGTWYSAFPYPNAADGALYVSPCWLHTNGTIRGYLKGVWVPLHHLPLNHNDNYSASGNLTGKSMLVQMILGQGNTSTAGTNGQAQCHFEYSDTWN